MMDGNHPAWTEEGEPMRILCVVLTGLTAAALADDASHDEARAITGADLRDLAAYWTADDAESGDAGGDVLGLDVRQCVEMALTQNDQVFASQDDVDAAKAKVGQARSGLRPQATGQMAFAYIDGLESSMGGLGVLSDLLIGGGISGRKNTRTDKFTVTQVLYAGGQIRAAIEAAGYLASSQEWQRQAILNELEFQTKQSYYVCLLTRAIVRVAQDSVTTFQRHLDDAEQMLEVGLISNFEVLRAKTEVGARQSDLVAAKNAQRLALVNLRRILALPQDQPLRLVGTPDLSPIATGLDALLEQAYENRPELLALDRGILAAQQNVRRAKGQFRPRAAATADWSNTDGGGSLMPDGWTFGLGIEWDIYTGGRRKHEVAEAKAQLSKLEHQRDDVRRLIELDARRSYILMEDALAKIREEKGTVELGREGRRLAQLRFQEGVGTQTETLDAELALTAAETALVRALNEYAVALAAIEKATGQSWVPAEAGAE